MLVEEWWSTSWGRGINSHSTSLDGPRPRNDTSYGFRNAQAAGQATQRVNTPISDTRATRLWPIAFPSPGPGPLVKLWLTATLLSFHSRRHATEGSVPDSHVWLLRMHAPCRRMHLKRNNLAEMGSSET
ncbi:hypothetical protein LIA77_04027 [Sarocladium implicatum]|nr:hypothetical protein LIA77_04027 [Sarocladium implicatum]